MLPKCILAGAVLSLAAVTLARSEAVIRVGEIWHYLEVAPGGSAPAGWSERAFDDTAWANAPSGFLLPEDDSSVQAVPQEWVRPSRVYLRKEFHVSDLKEVHSLFLRVEHELGFTAFLNGVEVAREDGPGVYFPSSEDEAGEEEEPELTVYTENISRFLPLLTEGENVLALEGDSSGISPAAFPLAATLGANFIRGPYIQNNRTNRVQIIWRTADLASTFVRYGTTPALDLVATNDEAVIDHVVTLTNLLADTKYFYQAGSDADGAVVLSDPASFHTFKAAGPVSFIVLGDSGQGTVAQGDLAEVMRAAQPDLVLHGGDIVYGGFSDATADTRIFNYYEPHMRTTPYFFAVGNHDLNCCGGLVDWNPTNWVLNTTNFQNTFYLPTNSVTGTEHFYSFDDGDAHFVALYNPWFANYVFTNGSDQFMWLTNDLAASRKPWKFLFFHHPIAHSGAHALRDYNRNDLPDQTDLMNLLEPVARQYGVQVVFGSHDHNFERFAPTNGVYPIVTGGGGAGVYQLSKRHPASAQFWPLNHVTHVTIDGDTLRLEALGTDGLVFDSMVIQKALPPPQVYAATWHTPDLQVDPGSDNGDGNFTGQTFQLTGAPVEARAGDFSNLGEFFVNNDATNLYLGIRNPMFYGDNNIFVFIESAGRAGVTHMAGLGNGVIDPYGEGVDGLDCLENLGFTNFAPSIGCVLGDEMADGNFRQFTRGSLALDVGQGVFYLDAGLSDVPGVALQQFNRSPEGGPVANDQNADLIELSIPFSALGGLMPGDTIKVAAVVGGGGFDSYAQTRSIDRAVLGTGLFGAGLGPVVVSPVTVQLAAPPANDQDGDGLADDWEAAHGLDPNSALGDDGPDGDPDRDGFSNLREQLAGTDPQDAASVLRVALRLVDSTHVEVSWAAVAGKKYQLEHAENEPAGFSPFTGPEWPRMALSGRETYEDDLSGAASPDSRFYRVRLVP